jgi:hypothetical protein
LPAAELFPETSAAVERSGPARDDRGVTETTVVLVLVIVTALAFDFTNGFHDTANAMATSIATNARRPGFAARRARGAGQRRVTAVSPPC